MGIGILLVLIVTYGHESQENKPTKCKCDLKEHFLPCNCAGAGTDKCDCIVIPRGYITEFEPNILAV